MWRTQSAAPGLLLTLLLSWGSAPGQFLGKISEKQEIEIGRQAAQEVERQYPILRQGVVSRYVQNLGERLARRSDRPELDYRFRVIDQEEANAFALPGGFIYVNKGILQMAQSESEVAGVLAHEIAHVTERHGIEQVEKAQRIGLGLSLLDLVLGRKRGMGENLAALGANLFAQGVFFKYSRDAEREADRVGVSILRRSEINPRGMVTLFQHLDSIRKSKPNLVDRFFSTHPSPSERIENVEGLLLPGDQDLRSDSREFQRIKKRLR